MQNITENLRNKRNFKKSYNTKYEENVSMKAIQEWLDHSDFSTTANVYAHLDINSKLLSAEAISSAFSFKN